MMRGAAGQWLAQGTGLAVALCLVVAWVAGRLSPFPLPEAWGALAGTQLSNLGTVLAVLGLGVMALRGQVHLAMRREALVMLLALLAYVGVICLVDIAAGRPLPGLQTWDLLRLLVLAAAMAVLASNPRLFQQFLICLVLVILIIAISDYIYWRTQRGVVMGGASLTRALLLALGISLAATIYRPQWLLALAVPLAAYFILSGSMKIAVISLVVVMVIGAIGLFSTRKSWMAMGFVTSIALTFGLSILSADFANTAQRLHKLSLSPEAGASATATPTPETLPQDVQPSPNDLPPAPAIHADCVETANPAYCSSMNVTINDQTERLRLWGHGLGMIASSPVLGHGVGAYELKLRYELDPVSKAVSLYTYSYPHNLLIDVGVTHGLVGMLALLGLLFAALAVMLSSYSQSNAATGVLAAGFGIFTSAMTGGDFYDARYLILLPFIALGFAQMAAARGRA